MERNASELDTHKLSRGVTPAHYSCSENDKIVIIALSVTLLSAILLSIYRFFKRSYQFSEANSTPERV